MSASEVCGYLFDLDGVLWIGERSLPGAAATIAELRRRDMRVRFVSNTSSQSHPECLTKLERLGFRVRPDEVFVASRATARHLAHLRPAAVVYVLGQEGLIAELKAAGLAIRTPNHDSAGSVDFVVVGRDERLSYGGLTKALHHLIAGASLVAVNLDVTIPTIGGPQPGAGAILASLTAMTNQGPDVMIAKPRTRLLDEAIAPDSIPADQWVLVGDTPTVDMAAGNAAGMQTVLLRHDTEPHLQLPLCCQPDRTIMSITELLD